MKRTLTLATGLAVGYVAGAHAGRERYEQIKQGAQKISHQPAVVDARENLREHATAATKTVADKVTVAASGLADKLHLSHDEEHDSPDVSPVKPAPGPVHAAPGGRGTL